MSYELNEHSWGTAWVRSDLKGQHTGHCLCYAPCVKFKPNQSDNCPRAQATYEHCIKWDCVTPMWECPGFDKEAK